MDIALPVKMNFAQAVRFKPSEAKFEKLYHLKARGRKRSTRKYVSTLLWDGC